jgi:copper oxidase (laccase) domain-containing protein
VNGIVRAAIGKMLEEFGTRPAIYTPPSDIGKCCYEVGPEVAAQFGATVFMTTSPEDALCI